jgi:hypothetical protein
VHLCSAIRKATPFEEINYLLMLFIRPSTIRFSGQPSTYLQQIIERKWRKSQGEKSHLRGYGNDFLQPVYVEIEKRDLDGMLL